jgi:hypothetical protein
MIRAAAAFIALVGLAAAEEVPYAHGEPRKGYFLITSSGRSATKFVVEITKGRSIRKARTIIAGTYTGQDRALSGEIVEGPTAYNPMWQFSLDAPTVRFFSLAMEVCDATPGYVENHLAEWMQSPLLKRWCPWTSVLEREVTGEVRRSARITCPPSTVKYTTKQCLHFFKASRFPFGPTYCRAQRCRGVQKEPVE